jgi:hypothetical protein
VTYPVLKFLHLLGLTLMGAGLIGVWYVLYDGVALGALRPDAWTLFAVGTVLALIAAAILTLVIPRLYPFEPGQSSGLRRSVA